jgi:hypothetical protein
MVTMPLVNAFVTVTTPPLLKELIPKSPANALVLNTQATPAASQRKAEGSDTTTSLVNRFPIELSFNEFIQQLSNSSRVGERARPISNENHGPEWLMRLIHKWLLCQANLPAGLEVGQVWKEGSAQRVASKEQRGASCTGTGTGQAEKGLTRITQRGEAAA